VPLRLTYLGVTNVFALLRLLPASGRDKDVKIRALPHQITILKRQLDTADHRGDEAMGSTWSYLGGQPADPIEWWWDWRDQYDHEMGADIGPGGAATRMAVAAARPVGPLWRS
jgi:hypothetical protein